MNPITELGAPRFYEQDFSRFFLRELRSDHAGETGAVYIYRGVLAVTRLPQNSGNWFTIDLRLEDNCALARAAESASQLLCVYIVDPAWFTPNRYDQKSMGICPILDAK